MPGLPLPQDLPPGDVYNRYCPTRQIIDHVMGRWGGIILGALRNGPRRFAELRREVEGISEKMLAQTLRDLQRDGLVHRRSFPVIPPHVEYSLTPLGVEAVAPLWALLDWIQSNLPAMVNAQNRYDSETSDA